MTSNFALEVAINSPKIATNPKIAQDSVRTYCLTLLSDAARLSSESETVEFTTHVRTGPTYCTVCPLPHIAIQSAIYRLLLMSMLNDNNNL